MRFKDISYLELWWPFCWRSKTICAILVEDFCEIILNLEIWNSGVLKYFLSRGLVAPLFGVT